MTAPPSEWLCSCGKWLPMGFSRHPHTETKKPSLEEMRAARSSMERGWKGDIFIGETTFELRTKEHKTR